MDALRDSLTRLYPWHDWVLPPGGGYAALVWKGAGPKPAEAAILAAGDAHRAAEAVERTDLAKESDVGDVSHSVWEMLFFLTNEVRGLKGQSTLTRAQFRSAVKARL